MKKVKKFVMLPDYKLENAKNGISLLRLMYAFLPTRCGRCRCRGRRGHIHLQWFYGMPWYNIKRYGYGSEPNDRHCRNCHNEMIRTDGFCHDCHWAWGQHGQMRSPSEIIQDIENGKYDHLFQ